jgi:hypothetical protein
MPTGIIFAYSVPDGAEILMDGNSIYSAFGSSRTPALIHEISADTHSVTFRLHGYAEQTPTARVSQGSYTTVNAILSAEKK